MANTTVNIRMDEELKQAEELFNEMGMTMTTAFTIFTKKVVRERRIPFEITAFDPFFSEANLTRLKKSIAQLEAGMGKEREFVGGLNEVDLE